MKKLIIIANKNWEAEPLLNALLNKKFRHPGLNLPSVLNHPREILKTDPPATTPRAVFDFNGNEIQVWCLQDLMDPAQSSSSSKEKMRVLPQIFEQQDVAAFIAFGTAGFPDKDSFNGSVVIGSNVFIHNPYRQPRNPASDWDDPRCEQFIQSAINKDVFSPALNGLGNDYRVQVESKFILPPMKPATKPIIIAARNYTALGIVNITDYDDYAWADHEGVHSFEQAGIKAPIGSIETTHGLIRLQSELPFLFVSGITDRLGYFNMEVTTSEQAQNYAAAFNAGIATAWLAPRLFDFI